MKSLSVLLCLYVSVSCVIAQAIRDAEPVVNSLPVSYWLNALVEKTTNASQRVEAQKVFKQAGTNLIPYLIAQLTVGDLARKHSDERDPTGVEERRQALQRTVAAEVALRSMGSCVTSAIPELTELMGSTNYGAVRAAAEILSDLGPQGVHELVKGLTYSNKEAREAIPSVLRHLSTRGAGTNLLAEVPAMFDSLDTLSMDKAFDCNAAIIQSVVAEYGRHLNSTNSNTRYIAAKTLGELGTSAQLAIPNLEELLTDPDKDVRDAAKGALQSIRGER